jgi:hypothetical protein
VPSSAIGIGGLTHRCDSHYGFDLILDSGGTVLKIADHGQAYAANYGGVCDVVDHRVGDMEPQTDATAPPPIPTN